MQVNHAFLAGPHPRAFVHRGWHAGELAGMENSLSAFRRAVSEGYHYLETDVRATSDGVVVVHHDAALDRTTDSSGLIAELPWRIVRRAKIAGREPVSRLEAVLDELPDARFNVDVKAEAAIEPLVATLRRTNAFNRVCVASFSEARLIKVRRSAGDGLLTSMGVGAIARLWAHGRFARVFRNSQYQPVAQVPLRQGGLTVVDRRLIAIARKRGIEVHVWTVDDPAMMHRLLDLGVDGLMTDHPHVLKEVLRSRGAWV